ncbi:MAG: mrdB, partial [Akkermansiaceae bacterium]|nr:mrdB [Akkermansiaceae bacterium]
MTPLFRKLLGLNWPLVFTMFGLLIFGVFSIESAARHLTIPSSSSLSPGDYYANKQKMWILVGSVVFFATALIDYRWFRWLAIPMWLSGLVLAVATKGVYEFNIGGLSFQPGQIALAAGVLMLAWLLQDLPRLFRLIPRVGWVGDEPFIKIGIIGIVTGISFLVIMKIGDMG